jgi:hypothetical protein
VDGIFDEGIRVGALSNGTGTPESRLNGERVRGDESTLEAADAAVLVHKHRLLLINITATPSAASHPCRVEGHTRITIQICGTILNAP